MRPPLGRCNGTPSNDLRLAPPQVAEHLPNDTCNTDLDLAAVVTAWPARPRRARPRHIPRPSSLRALHRVPSSPGVRAYLPPPSTPPLSVSVFPLRIDSKSLIGPMAGDYALMPSH